MRPLLDVPIGSRCTGLPAGSADQTEAAANTEVAGRQDGLHQGRSGSGEGGSWPARLLLRPGGATAAACLVPPPAAGSSPLPPPRCLCRLRVLQAHNVNALRAFLRDNQRDYAQLGRLGEAERDRIEEEVGAAVRSCSANIDKLQGMLASAAATAGSPARQRGPPSADLLAHRQGQVLILSERLRAATALFDRLRSLRYQQLQQAEANRLRRLPQREAAAGAGAPQTTAELHERLRQQQAAGGSIGQQQPQQQQQIDAENQALQLELLGMNDQVGEGRSGDDCHMLLVPLSWGACCWSRSLCGRRSHCWSVNLRLSPGSSTPK